MSPSRFNVGDRVRLQAAPTYLKTAESRPMLRPPQLVKVGEIGVITAAHPGSQWAVRFARGSFLLDSQQLERVPPGVGE
ncbi:regulatory protein SipA [Trichothermofontia sp.]